MNNRRTYYWSKHVQKVTFDSSDSFSVQEMDSMGTASKDFIKRSLACTQDFVRKRNQRKRAVKVWH